MKNLIYLMLLFCGIYLLSPGHSGHNSRKHLNVSHNEVIKEKNDFSDMEACIMTLKSDLSASSCLTPRTIQLTSTSFCERFTRSEEKLLQEIRIKGVNLLRKISEEVLSAQSLQVSSLRSSAGYHVFGLRKIII